MLCVPERPTMSVEIASASAIDTSADGACTFVVPQVFGPELCVVAGTTVTITDALVATGSRPLAILATDNATIGGTIDVSSTRTRHGAGADDLACIPSGPGAGSSNGAGGGAGASFGSSGGGGGAGSGGAVAGGMAAPASHTPTVVRGGCPGALGGIGTISDDAPGSGGGAIYLLAAGTLTITGTIDASGAGGGAGRASKGGGAGAGSGGMIVLWASTMDVTVPKIFANGGGGGGGADNGASGHAGDDPSAPSTPAAGGTGGGSAGPGPGGTGAYQDVAAQRGLDDVTGAGGGGGGGGVGFLLVISGQAIGGDLSPTPAF
jgi:hypothetical protein